MIKDDKLKPLMPSLRTKKRFLKIQVESEYKFDFKEISEYLNENILKYMGGISYSRSGIWILRDKFDTKKQELVLKVSLIGKDDLIGVLGIISKFGNKKINIEVKKVSGTLKGLNDN